MAKFVKALIFDLDGTLVDSRRDIADGVHYVQRLLHFPESSVEEIAGYVGNGVKTLFARALRTDDLDLIDKAVKLFIPHYREHCADHTRLYPGVMETMQALRTKKMAIVSNKPERPSQIIIEKVGLMPYISTVIGGETAIRKKPHPDPIHLALERLDAKASEAAVVGDSANDILAGQAAGVFTIGVRSNIGDPIQLAAARPDALLNRFIDLITHVQ